MSCQCGDVGCNLTPIRSHYCTVCGRPHYTSLAAEDCCDIDTTPDD